jgi:hypothetical protein
MVIAKRTAFDPGTQRFEFQFKLPEDAMISYEGYYGNIRYTILAIMDSSWITKHNASKSITIIQSSNEFPDKVVKEVAEHEGEDILEIEVDSQKYCIGNKISFRYRVNTEIQFKSLRAQIVHYEGSDLEGKQPMYHSETLWEEQILSDDVIRHEWNKWTFNINKAFPPWLMSENLQSYIHLKVIIVRPLRIDKSAEITLVSEHCPETIKSTEEEV